MMGNVSHEQYAVLRQKKFTGESEGKHDLCRKYDFCGLLEDPDLATGTVPYSDLLLSTTLH